MSKNFLQRTLTALILVALIIFMTFTNRIVLLIGAIILSSISLIEISRALHNIHVEINIEVALIFNLVMLITAEYLPGLLLLFLISLYLIVLMVVSVFSNEKNLIGAMSNLFAGIYISLTYSYMLLIKDSTWVFYIFGIAAATDTFAYLIGMAIGKHKLIERLSPKKTVEGALGGLVGGLVFTAIFLKIFNIDAPASIYLMALFASAMSQVGDLVASGIKRRAKIKDFGKIFKGHGGVMDRFDSILLITPLILLAINFFL